MRLVLALALGSALSACATELSVEQRIARADPAVSVEAAAQTAPVGTANLDAADDPAIWRNGGDPAASLIVATDKKAGLYVYGLDGTIRSFIDAGRVNNVDLRSSVPIGGQERVLVAASDRNDVANARIALFTLDPASARLVPLGTVTGGAGEAYGLCLYRTAQQVFAFLVLKDGTIRQFALDLSGTAPGVRLVRTLKLATQAEGCAVDEVSGRLYVGEEDRGLWRFDAKPDGATEGTLLAAADGKRIVADTEGVAVAVDGRGTGYLVVSSQGDNAYVVWRLPDESYVGRFRIGRGRVGSTEETDGIELAAGDFGPSYPGGLFVAQDGHNAPAAQNFKLVSWVDVLGRLAADKR